MFEIRPTSTGSFVIHKDGQRFSDSFYLTATQAEIARLDLERAWMAGCDHGEQVRAIQTIARKHVAIQSPELCAYHSVPLMNDGRCGVCMNYSVKERA